MASTASFESTAGQIRLHEWLRKLKLLPTTNWTYHEGPDKLFSSQPLSSLKRIEIKSLNLSEQHVVSLARPRLLLLHLLWLTPALVRATGPVPRPQGHRQTLQVHGHGSHCVHACSLISSLPPSLVTVAGTVADPLRFRRAQPGPVGRLHPRPALRAAVVAHPGRRRAERHAPARLRFYLARAARDRHREGARVCEFSQPEASVGRPRTVTEGR